MLKRTKKNSIKMKNKLMTVKIDLKEAVLIKKICSNFTDEGALSFQSDV